MRVKAPRVKEAPIHFECKLERVLELGPKRQALIGEVVYIHVDPAVMTNGYIALGHTSQSATVI
jgi:flavin reductase (DIM6/NTAB) family NADH-FMN oxidoreductase RutF